jgi:hypothetical protein
LFVIPASYLFIFCNLILRLCANTLNYARGEWMSGFELGLSDFNIFTLDIMILWYVLPSEIFVFYFSGSSFMSSAFFILLLYILSIFRVLQMIFNIWCLFTLYERKKNTAQFFSHLHYT